MEPFARGKRVADYTRPSKSSGTRRAGPPLHWSTRGYRSSCPCFVELQEAASTLPFLPERPADNEAVCRACYRSERSPSRSEEHTSELQSRLHLVCRLLLEKKKTKLTSKS